MYNELLIELVLGFATLGILTAMVIWTVETFKLAVEAIKEQQQ